MVEYIRKNENRIKGAANVSLVSGSTYLLSPKDHSRPYFLLIMLLWIQKACPCPGSKVYKPNIL
jgi:hypothetical protein